MFGSDWPVCTLAASYTTVHELASKLTATLNPAERHAVFHATADAVYRLG
jgi:L-fucono-1,5-lactonase